MRELMTAAAATIALASMQATAAEVKIDDLIVAKTIPDDAAGYRTQGGEGLLPVLEHGRRKSPESGDVIKLHRPHAPARPSAGSAGPAFASEHFRAAAPDLTVEIRKMVVADDYVTVHMEFKGHFTGAFGKAKGQGQSIDFVATDLLKIADGRVTDNWHIEDNLTLLSQMGVAKIEE